MSSRESSGEAASAQESAVPASESPGSGGSSEVATRGPSYSVITQYVKDLSFENINALQVFFSSQNERQPVLDISFDVHVVQRQEALPGEGEERGDLFEINLRINARAKIEETDVYVIEIVYTALSELYKIPDEHKGEVLYVDIPRLMFPMARYLVALLTREANYNSLLINSLDLVSMYRGKIEDARKRQQEQAAATGNGADDSGAG